MQGVIVGRLGAVGPMEGKGSAGVWRERNGPGGKSADEGLR